ncbi:hypothetical protein [Candidatus Albibeggiatoa sp. nov. NOAA]|uniref:hypothetical protein n=1 Tax=Candidatus Albibeggiatoa sp. nov. NOAA TaxID=3162724 RepID=UPI0032F972B9|nr:hypothetical protein [Thiotrichaceae bacterium]
MLRLSILVLFYTFISSVYAADMVVIRATDNAGYAKGQLLNNDIHVQLPHEAEMTVVFSSGKVLTVGSGFKGSLVDPMKNKHTSNKVDNATQLVASLSDFLYEQAHHEPPTTRKSGQERPSSAWQVDMSNRKRHYCVAPSKQVVLWRPSNSSKTAGTLEIKHTASNKRVKTVWPAHKTTLSWPKKLGVVYEDAYSVEVKNLTGQRFFKKLVLHKIPNDLPTKSHQVVWMVGRGCIPQANLLLASLK